MVVRPPALRRVANVAAGLRETAHSAASAVPQRGHGTNPIEHTVAALHRATLATGVRVALVATGAGGDAVRQLLAVPGASSTLVEAVVPYSQAAQSEYLGYTVQKSVKIDVVRDFALTARDRADRFCDHDSNLTPIGLAVSAALATNRSRRGANRALVSAATGSQVYSFKLELEKGRRDRVGEDRAVTQMLLRALWVAAGPKFAAAAAEQGVAIPEVTGLGSSDRIIELPQQPVTDPVTALLEGSLKKVVVHPCGRMTPDGSFEGTVLAGSFNPLHYGHEGLLAAAAAVTGRPPAFELAVTNADKGTLDTSTIRARVAQFQSKATLLLTAAPTFNEKAKILPGCDFVVGADTAERLVMPKYYGGTADGVRQALEALCTKSCRFVVAGRLNSSTNVFENFDAEKQSKLIGFDPQMFVVMSEAEFRVDISSSELRAKAAAQERDANTGES
eukprot:SAG31_NODE_5878_length_2278_cov_2.396053_2_plen_448_part_00